MAQGGYDQDLRQNQTCQAFLREAAIAAELIATGATLLGKADANRHGIYNQAFFSLSTGFERAAKLAFVLDHAITHDGKFPANGTLRGYGHDVERLLHKTDEIARQHRDHHETDLALPSTAIHQGIIRTLSEFASITRYYNLDYLAATEPAKTKQPIDAWHERVGKPILAKHYTPSRRSKDRQRARALHSAVGDIASIVLLSESGQSIDTLESLEINSAEVRVIQPYSRMYTMQIARFLAKLISDLRHEAFMKGMTDIPDLSEFFTLFLGDDAYFKKRTTWSIYSI